LSIGEKKRYEKDEGKTVKYAKPPKERHTRNIHPTIIDQHVNGKATDTNGREEFEKDLQKNPLGEKKKKP